jgi:23S rRNA (cytidine2498-2'-O)-methyltransferase
LQGVILAEANVVRNLLLYCRPGFEDDCAQEIALLSGRFGKGRVDRAIIGSGFVVFSFDNPRSALDCAQNLSFPSVTFARQIIAAFGDVTGLAAGNRVQPVVDAIAGCGMVFCDYFLETADTNEAKQLSPLCRNLVGPFEKALSEKGLLSPPNAEITADSKRLHIFFAATNHAIPGIVFVNNASPWPMGIPRLRFPAGAPSRSALKLEEAINAFMTPAQTDQNLRPKLDAVDLGASPGGWSWLLVSRGMRVTAVDNGRMDKRVMASGLINHVRGDAFTFSPGKPVRLMVCDVVEQPARIAKLAAQWIGRKWCNTAIFNLKLPMKKRYQEIVRCREIISQELKHSGTRYEVALKHLYHDREEITGFLRCADRAR